MTNVEAVRRALAELGDVPASELADHVERRFGIRIEPKFIPILKATIRDEDRLGQARREAGSEAGPQPDDPARAA